MLDLWLAALLDSSLKGLALCLAAALAALALRRASAAARHLVWRLAFAALLALPALAALLPAWRVPVPGLETYRNDLSTERPSPPSSLVRAPALSPRPSLPETEPRLASSSVLSPKAAEDGGLGAGEIPSWQAMLFGVWLAGAIAVLAVLTAAVLRVRRQRRGARPIRDEAWTALLARLCAELDIRRPVELVTGDETAMPMAWGWRRPGVLLPAGARDWPEPRRRGVLLHELAHVVRGDYAAQLTSEVARALYWFNPLVWMAARKLRLESEHACDDRVLTAGARASDYAGDLLEIARSLRAARLTAPAGLAMARPSQLAGRLLAVLDGGRNRRGVTRRLALPAWLVATCLVVPLASLAPSAVPAAARPPLTRSTAGTASPAQAAPAPPAPPTSPAPPTPPAPPGHHSSYTDTDHEVVTLDWSRDGHQIKMRTQGKFKLNDDWTAIASLAPGAKMRFEDGHFFVDRRLDVEPGSNGQPVYTWKINGEKRAFDAEGRQWLEGMLLAYVRRTGYEADRRVAWFLKRRGADGLLAEISQMPDDYVKRLYFQQLFAYRGLATDALSRALAHAGREIRSDYDLTQSLLVAADRQNLSGATALAYVQATWSIDSDYDQRRALTGLLQKGRLDPMSLTALLRAARQISSDYDLATLLVEVSKRSVLADARVRNAYAEAAKEIGSDYDLRQALSAAARRGDLSQDALVTVLRSAKAIRSGYDLATLLIEIAGKYTLSGAARDAYLDAAGSIGSSYDRVRAEAALRRGK
jgi:beta-lactamase regulating signal transducer with metallopeptidase domain